MTHLDVPLIDVHTHIGHLPGVVGDVYTAEDLCHIGEREGAAFMHGRTALCHGRSARHGRTLWGSTGRDDPAWADDVGPAAQHGFYGFKIHPVLDHYAVDRAALDGVFGPILTHTDVDGTPMSAACYEPLIQAYPDVVLILAHLRWGAIPLAKRYDNVYLDTTYVDPVTVEVGVDALGPTKILFGSDAAEGFDVGRVPGRVRPRRSHAGLVGGLRARGISETDLEQILYRNARALFKIETEEEM